MDLVITNDEVMVNNLSLNTPVGKSHHTIYTYILTSQAVRKHNPGMYTLQRGLYAGMREDAEKLTWCNVDECILE